MKSALNALKQEYEQTLRKKVDEVESIRDSFNRQQQEFMVETQVLLVIELCLTFCNPSTFFKHPILNFVHKPTYSTSCYYLLLLILILFLFPLI